jgi:tRNA-splicing ligase RtcB
MRKQEGPMAEQSFEYMPVEGGAPVKMWTKGVAVDPKAREQLASAARMPFIFKHVAVMPDVHVGIGATVGSVIPTKGAVIPARGRASTSAAE